MCRQGGFYVFNQAPSFNLQKYIRRHIKRKNWHFFLKWAMNISFLPLKKINILGMATPGMSMPCTLCYAHIMPAHAVHCMPYGRINSDMPTATVEPKPV
jgi:hypothetical protein